ncbi:DMT family transporter [Abyssibius alkaniclasticus]|uniref:DMT family transporter n=1 Tax=Abyssibius alkaniclasticus TaxID=2881234 RepID=UPI00405A01DD
MTTAQIETADAPVRGIVLMIGFGIVGPFIDMFAKLTSPGMPVGEIALARFLVQSAVLLAFAYWRGWLHRPGLREICLHLLRGGVLVVATMLIVAAFKVMPLADTLAIFFVMPMIVTLMGAVFLGEPVGWRRILASLVGFGGALLVIQPSFGTFGFTAVLPLLAAVFFATYLILTRRMGRRMNQVVLQAYTATGAVALIVPMLALGPIIGWQPIVPIVPVGMDWVWLMGVGLSTVVAHMLLSYAFAMASIAILAPLQYLEIVSATIIGYLVFNDLPNALTFLGIAIIVSSGIYIFFRERQVSRASLPPAPGRAG